MDVGNDEQVVDEVARRSSASFCWKALNTIIGAVKWPQFSYPLPAGSTVARYWLTFWTPRRVAGT